MLDRIRTTVIVPDPAATARRPSGPRTAYGQLIGLRGRLTGTDAATRISVTDADGLVVYLDAADKNYKASTLDRLIVSDDTTTGLSSTPVDPTGAAIAAGQIAANPIVRSPLTVAARAKLGERGIRVVHGGAQRRSGASVMAAAHDAVLGRPLSANVPSG